MTIDLEQLREAEVLLGKMASHEEKILPVLESIMEMLKIGTAAVNKRRQTHAAVCRRFGQSEISAQRGRTRSVNQYDRLTEKMYAPDTSDAYAKILRQMRRDIRGRIRYRRRHLHLGLFVRDMNKLVEVALIGAYIVGGGFIGRKIFFGE